MDEESFRMKVGDLVKWNSGLTGNEDHWRDWMGLIVREIPGTDEMKVIVWNKDSNVRTSNPARDLRLAYEK